MNYAYIYNQIPNHQIITINVIIIVDFAAYTPLRWKEAVTGFITNNSHMPEISLSSV